MQTSLSFTILRVWELSSEISLSFSSSLCSSDLILSLRLFSFAFFAISAWLGSGLLTSEFLVMRDSLPFSNLLFILKLGGLLSMKDDFALICSGVLYNWILFTAFTLDVREFLRIRVVLRLFQPRRCH